MRNCLIAFFILFLSSSCTRLHVRSQGQIQVSLTPQIELVEAVEVKGRLEYYLWGQYPANGRTLFIDKILQEQGIYSVANTSVSRQRNFQDILASFLSFGMYTPLSYTIVAYKKKLRK